MEFVDGESLSESRLTTRASEVPVVSLLGGLLLACCAVREAVSMIGDGLRCPPRMFSPVVDARVRMGFGLGSSCRSHIPAVECDLVMRSRLLPIIVGVGGMGGTGGIAKAALSEFGVGGVMPETSVEPVLEPEPARFPEEETGRRNPDAREVLRLLTLSHARTSSPAIWRTRTAWSCSESWTMVS